MFRSAFAALAIILFTASGAFAQIELSGGYSNLHLAGSDQNLKNADGFGLDLRASFAPLPLPVLGAFRIGTDIGWRRYNAGGGGTSLLDPDKSDLDLFTLEARAAWRQQFGAFFIEPNVSGGLMVGTFSTSNHFDFTDFNQTSAGWSVRPGVAAGFKLGIVTFGLEGSYRIGNIKFHNDVGGDLREWYAGVFAGISF